MLRLFGRQPSKEGGPIDDFIHFCEEFIEVAEEHNSEHVVSLLRYRMRDLMLGPRGFGSLRCTHRGLTRVHAQTRAANQMQILTPKPASHRTMLPVKTGPRRTRYPKAYVITGTASKTMIAHLL